MIKFEYKSKKIKELCEKHNIKLLILHGSYAKNLTHKDSDIDVGILSNKKIDNKEYFSILRDFGELFGDKFDPAFLNTAEPMINFHVAINGKLLYEDQKGSFANFKIESIAKYNDTKKFRNLEKLYIKKAIGAV